MLCVTAENGREAFVQLLLEKVAHVSSSSGYGMKALYCAARNQHMNVIELLLDNGLRSRQRARMDVWRDNRAALALRPDRG